MARVVVVGAGIGGLAAAARRDLRISRATGISDSTTSSPMIGSR